MPLDFNQTITQIDSMASKLATAMVMKRRRLETALAAMKNNSQNLSWLRERVSTAMTTRTSTWLAAGIVEGLDLQIAPAMPPQTFTVLASDGSHIDIDRHYSAHCFLINIGLVKIIYGQQPEATISSSPHLYFEDKDVLLEPGSGDNQYIPLEGPLLGAKRSVEECAALVNAIQEVARTKNNTTTVCLLDGSLVLWGLGTTYPRFVSEALITNGLLKYLSQLEEQSLQRPISLASYISFPRNTEVANTIRLAICPFDDIDCDRNCPPGTIERPCDILNGITDRDIFQQLLKPGERSAIFRSFSNVVTNYYGHHHIHFFYLNVGEEIARVEIPSWVAKNEQLLTTTHAIIFDQCHRGNGYPVALTEAHEQAVITTSDREEFWKLVEESLARKNIKLVTSIKSQSKRARWL